MRRTAVIPANSPAECVSGLGVGVREPGLEAEGGPRG